MKVVLVNPSTKKGKYKSKESSIPHVGIGYLASYLESRNVQCDVIDGKSEDISIEELSSQIIAHNPDLLGITAMTPDIISASLIAKNVKKQLPKIQIVFGGPHITALPEDTLSEYREIDYIVIGEGEVTLYELTQAISSKKKLSSIKGLGYRKGEKIVINPPRDYIQNLDELPRPAWDKFKSSSSIYAVSSSRGCPFRCIFCMRGLGKKIRERSAQNVVDEIEWVVEKYHPQKITFLDETFTLKKKRVMEITDLLIKKGLHKKVKWIAQTRVDRVDEEIFSQLKAAGCNEIELGVESGNREILKNVSKDIDLDQVEKAVKMAKKAKLRVGCTFILGHPFETKETIKDTINFAVKLKPHVLSFGIMSPYPGTKIWEMAQANEGNYRLLSKNWEEFLRFGGGCLELTNLSRYQLEMMQVKAYITFYLKTFNFLGLLQYGLPRYKQVVAVIKKLFMSFRQKKISDYAEVRN